MSRTEADRGLPLFEAPPLDDDFAAGCQCADLLGDDRTFGNGSFLQPFAKLAQLLPAMTAAFDLFVAFAYPHLWILPSMRQPRWEHHPNRPLPSGRHPQGPKRANGTQSRISSRPPAKGQRDARWTTAQGPPAPPAEHGAMGPPIGSLTARALGTQERASDISLTCYVSVRLASGRLIVPEPFGRC